MSVKSWSQSSLVCVMTCHLCGTKLCSEQIVDYCQYDIFEMSSANFQCWPFCSSLTVLNYLSWIDVGKLEVQLMYISLYSNNSEWKVLMLNYEWYIYYGDQWPGAFDEWIITTARAIYCMPLWHTVNPITHWNWMATSLQTTFFSAFSRQKISLIWFEFHWSLFLSVWLTI